MGKVTLRKVIISLIVVIFLPSMVINNSANYLLEEDELNTISEHNNWWDHWIRDKNHNKIDDLIDDKINSFSSEERIAIHICYNHRPTDEDIERLSMFDFEITYVCKYIDVINIRNARLIDIKDIVKLKDVVMVSLQPKFKYMLDIASPAVKARNSPDYSPKTAWQLGYTGSGINIAILDSGVDDEHESLEGKYVTGVELRGLLEIEGNPDDTDGHGTHCAGIAMGSGGVSGNYKGTAPDAKLIDVKIGGNSPVYNGGNALEGIEWCIDHKHEYNIRIISLSSGGMGANDDGNQPCSQAVNKAVDNGIVVVVIAGNDGPDNEGFDAPASADKAIVVGAINDKGTINRDDDVIASFSSRGPRKDDGDDDPYDELKPDVVAPGVNIMSARATTAPGIPATDDYIEYDGTSMAAPMVSGIIALMLQANPDLTPEDVKEILHQTAEARGNASYPSLDPKYNVNYGYGIVDAYEAVKMAMEYEPPGNGIVEGLDPVELNPPTSITNNTMLLSWGESSNADFNRYEIHISNSQNFIPYSSTLLRKIMDRSTTSYKVTNLKANTTYFFKIRVYNTQNQYVDSNEVYGTTLLVQNPDNSQKTKNEFSILVTIIITICIILLIILAVIYIRKRKKEFF